MKAVIAIATALCAYVVYVNATACEHHDMTHCYEEISCPNDTKEVGCEHNVCTCVDKAEPCLQRTDCVMTTCEHKDEEIHCDNQECMCVHVHHGPGK